jgi:hypothetical protein
MRPLTALFLITSLGLSAQEDPGGNRMGIGLSALVPMDTWGSSFATGFQAGLLIHFNRESRHLGRLRIDYLQSDSKGLIQTGIVYGWNGSTSVPTPMFATSRMEAYSVVYEWMPHLENHSQSGLFGIFGMGGTLWNETRHTANTSGIAPFGYIPSSYTETDLGFTLSAGLGWRFNPHATLETRFVNSNLNFRNHANYGPNRSYLTFGTSLRF